jgi:hypothetical protein
MPDFWLPGLRGVCRGFRAAAWRFRVVLLVAALHNSWEMTLIIVGR